MGKLIYFLFLIKKTITFSPYFQNIQIINLVHFIIHFLVYKIKKDKIPIVFSLKSILKNYLSSKIFHSL